MAKICPKCGTVLDDDRKFCTECGAAVEAAGAPSSAVPVYQTAAAARPGKSPQPQSTVLTGGDAPPPPGSRYEPISTWGYIGISLLMCIPLVGIILAIVWAFGGCRKINKRNFARATLIMMAISLAIGLILSIAMGAMFRGVVKAIEQETGVSLSGAADSGKTEDEGGLGGLLGGIAGLAGESSAGGPDVTNSDIEELEKLDSLLGDLEDVTGEENSDWDELIDGAIEANREAEAANDGWPSTLREYPGGTATAVASYRTEISDTTLEEMMGWIEDLKKDGFEYQDFYDFGMTEEDMLGMNGWWAYDGNTYLSVSYSEGTVIVDHTKELPDLSGLFG